MPAACKGNALLTDDGCATNGFDNFDKIWFWRTPTAKCEQEGKCVPYSHGPRTTSPSSASNAIATSSARPLKAGPLPRWRSPMSPAVRFVNVCRHFGAVRAVDDVTLDIAEGEFFAMLGPSGSGKTTCLRLIAGFEQPTDGHIEIFGETAEACRPTSATSTPCSRTTPCFRI